MKIRCRIIWISVFLTLLSGCQNADGQKTDSVTMESSASIDVSESVPDTASESLAVEDEAKEEDAEPAEGFILKDGRRKKMDMFIPLADCVCEYDSGDFQIYTKYLPYGNEYSANFGTIIYLKTQEDSQQIFTPAEYCIDYENGILYYIEREEDGAFDSIYKYCAGSVGERIEVNAAKALSSYVVEEWLAGSYQLPLHDSDDTFSDRKLIVTALETDGENSILKGEAWGTHIPTGKYCHIDWELNDMTGEETAAPHERKIYEEETDKEIFAACAEAFDKIEKGDWTPLRYNEYLSPHSGKERNWLRMDINGDGLPELIEVNMQGERFDRPIEFILAYTGGIMQPVEVVYTDLNDYTEYLFLAANGNLIYDCSSFGLMSYGGYTRYQFDESWKKRPISRLELYYFFEEDFYERQGLKEDFEKSYPDTFGSRGSGFYAFISRPQSAGDENAQSGETWDNMIEKEITLEEFLEEYKQMTGFDFFTVQGDFAPYQ